MTVYWRDLDGLVLVVATVIDGCWGSVKGNITRRSGNQVACGQCGAMRISLHRSHWTFSRTCGNRAAGG